MTDYKEYAKQMREKAVKNEQGNIVCSPELWEEIASVIERAIVPPCKVGDVVYRISTKHMTKMRCIQETKICRIAITKEGMQFFCECNVIATCVFGKTVFLTKEEAEQALCERSKE